MNRKSNHESITMLITNNSMCFLWYEKTFEILNYYILSFEDRLATFTVAQCRTVFNRNNNDGNTQDSSNTGK